MIMNFYGKKLFIEFVNLYFRDDNIKNVSLNVYDYNKNTTKLYRKIGFEIDEII